MDNNLSWKFQINNVALKISRTVGVVARLRHFVPRTTLLNIYQSLILPHLTYGLAAWDQAAKTHLQKILVLQKRVLRLMYFSEPRAHAVPLFISSKILPLQMLYAEKVSSIMKGEVHNREEGEMARKSREEGEIGAKMKGGGRK